MHLDGSFHKVIYGRCFHVYFHVKLFLLLHHQCIATLGMDTGHCWLIVLPVYILTHSTHRGRKGCGYRSAAPPDFRVLHSFFAIEISFGQSAPPDLVTFLCQCTAMNMQHLFFTWFPQSVYAE